MASPWEIVRRSPGVFPACRRPEEGGKLSEKAQKAKAINKQRILKYCLPLRADESTLPNLLRDPWHPLKLLTGTARKLLNILLKGLGTELDAFSLGKVGVKQGGKLRNPYAIANC